MQQFIAGFVIALLAAAAVAVFFLRKKSHKAQTNENKHLKQLEELSKLTGKLAHEIKNPLSTIKVHLKLTAEELQNSGADEQSCKRTLRKIVVIQKETDRLERILDGFLCYIDRTELQLATIDVNSLMSDMIDFYSPQARSHSITIRHGLHSQPIICKIDGDMLKQVVLNLFINARQAMNEGGELIIRTARQKENAVIQISNTGSGIAADKLPKIFDAYYSSRPDGSGLGLATAKKIVEAHNGTITVNSDPGKGTSFTISLPVETE